ncbi:hypothetical protein JGU66_25710 [Myxococcaceae bacterium JPH2]|nr:hypothetical protein [Myxococcaceae bacterium JPH2]
MWVEIIVMPRDVVGASAAVKKAAKSLDRRAVYERGVQESQRFRESLVGYLDAQGLAGGVKWMSEPGSLPQVTLVASPTVLEQLRQAPQFEAGMTMPLEMLL